MRRRSSRDLWVKAQQRSIIGNIKASKKLAKKGGLSNGKKDSKKLEENDSNNK